MSIGQKLTRNKLIECYEGNADFINNIRHKFIISPFQSVVSTVNGFFVEIVRDCLEICKPYCVSDGFGLDNTQVIT